MLAARQRLTSYSTTFPSDADVPSQHHRQEEPHRAASGGHGQGAVSDTIGYRTPTDENSLPMYPHSHVSAGADGAFGAAREQAAGSLRAAYLNGHGTHGLDTIAPTIASTMLSAPPSTAYTAGHSASGPTPWSPVVDGGQGPRSSLATAAHAAGGSVARSSPAAAAHAAGMAAAPRPLAEDGAPASSLLRFAAAQRTLAPAPPNPADAASLRSSGVGASKIPATAVQAAQLPATAPSRPLVGADDRVVKYVAVAPADMPLVAVSTNLVHHK